MGRRERYELRIARLDGKRPTHEPEPVVEVFDLEDTEEFEQVCARHFVPLACAAEQSRVWDRLRDMPFLVDYQLEIRPASDRPTRHKSKDAPIATSRSTYGWRE